MHVAEGKAADKLVYMANQIGKFFATRSRAAMSPASPPHQEVLGTAHAQPIFAHLDAGGAGLDPLALKALQKLKAEAAQTSGAHPAADAVIEPSG